MTNYNLAADLIERLRPHAEVVVTGNAPEELRRNLADADAAILTKLAEVTADVLGEAPRLRAIATVSAGTEHVDLNAAQARNIRIVSGAGVNAVAVAEFVIGGMVAGHRNLLGLHLALSSGQLDWSARHAWEGATLAGSTLGLVGFGRVGQAVAQRAVAAFDVNVLVYDPFHQGHLPSGVTLVDELDELLERSLTVSVHAALTPATRGLLGSRQLRLIGADGVLIHTARGPIVDEDALIAALDEGALKAAVIDVFNEEPPAPDVLARLAATGRTLLTPHMAGVTRGMSHSLFAHAVDGIVAVLSSDPETPASGH